MVELGKSNQMSSATDSTHIQKNALNPIDSIRDTAAKLCKDYLHGAWRKIKSEDMIIKKVR